ncbi:hypothetical protein CERSUDRAFT_105609 [Gelatoporia subvermispora B]|uniref:Uncharacterized protein n=1 Tax=Ceriporiopsis subvermispora (strain B) TaxID=914234 RepID=M2PMP9_CERS8|nr:hypothetical protein CERSUDRAFT_105609 [Gelatoporia subvermispora B]
MTLLMATKDISEKPSAFSVTNPVDKEKANRDIERKLRFYGVVSALQQSRVPTNDQIDAALTYAIDHSPIPTDELSPAGQTLIQDIRDILDSTRTLVQEKNSGELLQNFVWHTRDVDTDRAKKDPNEVLPVDNDKVRSDAQTAQQHLRTLASLVLTNSEVRKLIEDFSVIGRDLLSRGAMKAAEMTRPDEERLRRVDEPAPDHRFVSEGGREVGPNETPVPEVQIPGTGHRVKHDPRHEDPIQGTRLQTESGEEKRADQLADEAQQTRNCLAQRAQEEAQNQQQDIRQRVGDDPVPNDQEEAQQKKRSLQQKMASVKDSLTGAVPPEHRDKAQEHTQRVKDFFREEYFPEERRDQLIWRMKKAIYECQNHRDYKESMQWLLDIIEEYASHGRTVAEHGKDSHQKLTSDPALQQSMSELRTLLERFANGQSLDQIGNAMRALYEDSQNDEGLRHWFHDVDAYIREVLLQPGFVLDDQCNEQANTLRDNGRQFYDGKYKGHFDNLFNSITDWFSAFGSDPLNRRWGSGWAKLTKDLLFDSDGNLQYKPELWQDIKNVILPGLIDWIGYVPIPRIEYTDDAIDLVIENMALAGSNLFPNVVSMEARNFLKFSPYKNIGDEQHHEVTLTFSQIHADMRDMAFYYRKKTGMPKMTDSGIADVLLGGTGMTVTAHIASATRDRSSVFHVKDVNVKVDSLKFSIRDSKHDTLYKALGPLATGLIKKQLQKAIGQAVTTALEYVDGQLVSVRDQMAEAKQRDDTNRAQVLKEQLFDRQKAQAEHVKGKADERNAQFKVVTQPGHELLPDKGHPEGWVKKTAAQQQVASSGSEWRSDAFNIRQ